MKNALLISGKCSKCECDLHKFSVSKSNESICRYCYAHYFRDKYKNDPTHKLKQNARISAMLLVKAGVIILEPCKLCGSRDSEMHHPDYSNTTDVTFLCKKCHTDIHTLERKVKCA